MTLRGLAIGMLLHSGNDSAGAAAVKVGGTTEGFVAMMNERAAEMGLTDTHFATPSGLDAMIIIPALTTWRFWQKMHWPTRIFWQFARRQKHRSPLETLLMTGG